MRQDPQRLAVLKRSMILDTPAEQAYDDLTRLFAGTMGVPIAMVNLLDADRDWFKARLGIDVAESPAATSFCQAFLEAPGTDVIVAEDTAADDRFAQHPLVLGTPHIRFYAAARLVVDGETLGTLCGYDVQPHAVDPARIDDLRTMARAVSDMLARRAAA